MGAEEKTAFLRLLGLAKRAGRAELGEEGTGMAAAAGKARLILTASDAAANSVRRAAQFAEGRRTIVLSVPFSKAELGEACGRACCAMLAITESGLALSAAVKLADCCPGRYDGAVEALRTKDTRIRQRRGKKRPRS